MSILIKNFLSSFFSGAVDFCGASISKQPAILGHGPDGRLFFLFCNFPLDKEAVINLIIDNIPHFICRIKYFFHCNMNVI